MTEPNKKPESSGSIFDAMKNPVFMNPGTNSGLFNWPAPTGTPPAAGSLFGNPTANKP
jgi:hypothetical protein